MTTAPLKVEIAGSSYDTQNSITNSNQSNEIGGGRRTNNPNSKHSKIKSFDGVAFHRLRLERLEIQTEIDVRGYEESIGV